MSLAKAVEQAKQKLAGKKSEGPELNPLEIALEDFESATSKAQKVEALKAFIELSRD